VGALVLAIAPCAEPWAQQAPKVYQLGVLSLAQPPRGGSPRNPYFEAMSARLRELGYSEGSNLRLVEKWAAGKADQLPALADELVASKVDVILAAGNPAVDAARRATQDIPIVMVAADPVAAGFVNNLSHPNGNLTGVSFDAGVSVWSKRLQLLKQAAPGVRRVAVLSRSTSGPFAAELNSAAKQLGVTLIYAPAKRVNDLPAAFAAIEAGRPDALFVSDTVLFFHYRRDVIKFAARHRLPDIHGYREAVQEGALMAYAPDLIAAYRQVASYVDRLFKGARPADLPIEQPTKFEFVVNLRTAKALNLDLPQSLLLSADRVIE
jgi:putative ABC transport system substrate-binding protein